MAKNDAVLLDGIVGEKAKVENLDVGETFELFAFEQLLKSYDLTRQEIDIGWVDGKNDGGIDGFFTFINGSLLVSPEDFPWPKKGASIEVWIINCKHHSSFKQDPLNTLIPTIEEFFDFGKAVEDFDGHYSSRLLVARENLITAFRATASGVPRLQFKFAYASRGDVSDLAENVEARGNQIKRIVSDFFSDAEVTLDYVGATELIALHRKQRFVLELPYTEQLSTIGGAYVVLVPIAAYADFVSDEQGHLRRYLFDSNVRDFLGSNSVNQDIEQTLVDENSPDFWWLNNGVTILATRAVPLGKTSVGNALQLHDVQIVNGLQTTQTIFKYFSEMSERRHGSYVLIKVIVSDDPAVRDKIIRATNNQSSIQLASLSATDKIQLDIEEILYSHGWYYERRRNYYKNIGKPLERFVEPLFLAQGVVALVRKAPHAASRLKTRFMRDPLSYESIFSDRLPIVVWPKIAAIMKLVDSEIAEDLPRKSGENRLRASWRGAVAITAVAEVLGTFDYSIAELIELDERVLQQVKISDILRRLLSADYGTTEISKIDTKTINYGLRASIGGVEAIGRWQMPKTLEHGSKKNSKKPNQPQKKVELAEKDIENVASRLPAQPWPSGVQREIAIACGLSLRLVARIINYLIAAGRFNNQYDGVVVDCHGKIVAVDASRADPRHLVGEDFVRHLQNGQPPSLLADCSETDGV